MIHTPKKSRGTLKPQMAKLPKDEKKTTENGGMNRYRVVDRADGVECNIDGNPRTVLLEGPKIGTLQHIALGNKAGLLAAHNAQLLAAGEKQFPA